MRGQLRLSVCVAIIHLVGRRESIGCERVFCSHLIITRRRACKRSLLLLCVRVRVFVRARTNEIIIIIYCRRGAYSNNGVARVWSPFYAAVTRVRSCPRAREQPNRRALKRARVRRKNFSFVRASNVCLAAASNRATESSHLSRLEAPTRTHANTCEHTRAPTIRLNCK